MDRDKVRTRYRDWWERICHQDRVWRNLLVVGLAGILLIAVSGLTPRRKQTTDSVAVTLAESQVEQALEQRITTLLREVEGVGSCRVMVTLECGEQMVYAAHTVSAEEADGSASFNETYLMVETSAGPAGLLITRLQPLVKGVAVVCDGGGNDTVRQRVIQVVSTAFHISERRVCVVQQE